MLSAIREIDKDIRFYFAASSEMFGKVHETPQSEDTPFHPRSAYGISKVTGFDLTRNYREAYSLYAASGILFNHESPRRGFEFVTRKISNAVARIKKGLQKKVKLGNIQAKRDWGFAGDYVEAMWLMLQQKNPDDFVIGTGQSNSIEEFANLAFSHVGLNYKDFIEIDPSLIRPAEVDTLIANYNKANKILGWNYKVSFENLVKIMVEADLKNITDQKS
tara:strand:- start:17780 stop:18436 length:657 start_codon:yes stop_codon:yes gene_type:complete